MLPLIQNILSNLVYDPQKPLLFHSTFFLFFFIVILLFYPFSSEQSESAHLVFDAGIAIFFITKPAVVSSFYY